AWIGSIQYALIFLPGLLVGRLFDLGYLHAQLIPASLAIVVSTIVVAECKEYWHFMLCQGIVTGVSFFFSLSIFLVACSFVDDDFASVGMRILFWDMSSYIVTLV
ncbi:hypothetical protein FRC03_012741, partial [Tulasnella sp. 419]